MLNRKPVVDQVFGANKAPMATVLNADFAALAQEVDAAISATGDLPALKSDKALGEYGQHVTALRALAASVDGNRKNEGAPLLDATRELNAWFNELKSRLDTARAGLERDATDYTRAKEAAARAAAAEEARKAREAEALARQKAETATGLNAAKAEGKAEQAASVAERAERAADASTADTVRTRVGGVTASARTVWDFEIADYDAIDLNKLRPYFARPDVEKAIRSLVRIQKGAASIPGVRVFEDVKATFRK